MTRFESKVAIVTGAGSGISRAVAHRLVAEGASVFGVDIDAARLRSTKAAVGDGLVIMETASPAPSTRSTTG
jgi:NAD(P)-dependent dehydrogenase (short-subunit alcohol dehydrogenase family)